MSSRKQHSFTWSYANARRKGPELRHIVAAARAARREGLTVAAGHGLTVPNVRPIASMPEIEELNIGHSIVARAALVGLDKAVREMIALMQHPRRLPSGAH